MTEPAPVARHLNEDGLHSLLEALPSAALYTDLDFTILDCNLEACRLLGYSPSELTLRHLGSLLAPGVHSAPAVLHDTSRSGERFEVLWSPRAGTTFAADTLRQTVTDNLGHKLGFLLIMADPLEQRESREAITARQEADRLDLARELHDGAVQELVAIGFSLAQLWRKLKGSLPEVDLAPLQDIMAEVASVARRLRGVVTGLRPAALEHFGLSASLEMLAAKLLRESPGRLPEFSLELESAPWLSHPQQLCFFRCCQEAMLNALRHAGADHLHVRLREADGEARLTITDDGAGFIVPAQLHELVRSEHFGLAGLAERVALVGGQLRLLSQPGEGTTVEVSLRPQGALGVRE